MKQEEAQAIFTLAGIHVLRMEPLIDGYGYSPDDPRFYTTVPRCVWWFVKTNCGWIKIGWRKRVINIDWSDTGIECDVTEDDVTKEKTMVHAYSTESAIQYLKVLAIQSLFSKTITD
jgi:hypothetical protein